MNAGLDAQIMHSPLAHFSTIYSVNIEILSWLLKFLTLSVCDQLDLNPRQRYVDSFWGGGDGTRHKGELHADIYLIQ